MSLTIPIAMLFWGCQLGCWDTVTKSPLQQYLGGGLAGKFVLAQGISVATSFAVYPLDTVRRRLQVDGGDRPVASRLYNGPWDCAKQIWRKNGSRGFFSGAGANTIRVVGGAMTLVLYDEFRWC